MTTPDERSPSHLLIGTSSGMFVLADGEAEPEPTFEDRDVTALAAGRDGVVWAVADRRSIVRRDPTGAWTDVARSDELAIDCLLPTPDGTLAGTDEAHLLRLGDHGELVREAVFDAVAGRDDWYTPWGGPPAVRSLALDLAGRIHANVHVGGIPCSTDGGASWEPTIDIDADVHQVIAHPKEPDVVLAAGAVGLAISEDGGASWRIESHGMFSTYARAVAVGGGTILVTAATGPHGGRGAVYRTTLEDSTLEKCTEGLPEWFDGNIDTGWLVADDGMVAFATSDGDVFVSQDEGAVWRRAAEGLPPIRWLGLAAASGAG